MEDATIKFLNMIRKTIKTSHSIKTEELIVWLNTRITGWANYYRHVVAKKIFGYVDHKIFWALWKWIKRRHSQKSSSWRIKNYFRNNKLRHWIFFAKFKDNKGNKQIIELAQAACIKIERYIKIKADANPYDSKFKEYFAKRRNYRMKNSKNIGANTTTVGLLGM